MRSFLPSLGVPWLLSLLLVAGLAPAGVAAADDNPATWSEIRPPEVRDYSLTSITFEGNRRFTHDQLNRALDPGSANFFKSRPLKLDALDGDTARLLSLYSREGHWDARVTTRVAYHQESQQARVVFQIEEGVGHRVGKITVEGNAAFSQEEILGWTKLQSADAFDLNRTGADRKSIEENYANRGFYLVHVVADVQRPAVDSTSVAEAPRSAADSSGVAESRVSAADSSGVVNDLVFVVTEGPRFTIGKIDVQGNEFTDSGIIRRELKIREGDVLSREHLEESRTALFATGYFSRVEITPDEKEASEGKINVLVRVIERKMRFFGFGLGYGTRDQFRFAAEWGHRNFLGRGKRASVRAIVASELFPVDLVRTRIEAGYVEPWLFGTRTTGSMDVFLEERQEFFTSDSTRIRSAYDLQLIGLTLNANRRLTRSSRLWLALLNEWADVDAEGGVEPPDDVRPDITRSFTMTAERDRRNDYFEPERGFVNRAILGFSGGVLGGDNDYWKSIVEASWYRRVGGVVVAGRVRTGLERVYGQSDQIPDRDRFKLGGATTVRGYREQDIGPGDFLILGNLEFRTRLMWIIHGGVFLDGGNAWPTASNVSLADFSWKAGDDPAVAAAEDVRWSTGAGLRVETPVGPVRLDFGYKLKKLPAFPGDPEEDRWRFHLSLGHVF